MNDKDYLEIMYPRFRAQMQSGDTILWRSANLLGQAIRLFSHADVNHASTIIDFRVIGVDRVMIAEALAGGIQLHSLTERLKTSSGQAYWIRLKDKYAASRPGIRSWALDHIDVGYDYSALFEQIFTRVKPNAKSLFCSEFDFMAKRNGGKIKELENVKDAPRPGDLEGLGIYEKRIRIK